MFGWINQFNMLLVAVLLIPEFVFVIRFRNYTMIRSNRWINLAEQFGRFSCIAGMIFPMNGGDFGFASDEIAVLYTFGGLFLLLLDIIIWIIYYRKPVTPLWYAAECAPVVIFLFCGILLRDYLLVICALIFGVARIYIAWENKDNFIVEKK